MNKKSLSFFAWLFGGFFILFGISFVVNWRMFPFNFIGVIFIAVGYQIIKNRKMNWISNKLPDNEKNILMRKAGEDGEKEVVYALDWLDKDKYIVFNNISLQHNGKSQQFDHIVIGPNGIFNIETKAYSGKIIIDEHGNWRREKSGRIEGIENPLFQTQRHHKVLNSILGESYPIVDVVVLADKSCIIEGLKNSPLNIFKVDTLQYYIENYRPNDVIHHKEFKEIENIIKSSANKK